MVIRAQIQPAQNADRRRGARHIVQLISDGLNAGRRFTEVLIHNISPEGLLVQTSANLSTGEEVEIVLPRSGPSKAEVVWSNGDFFGCRFREPVSSATLAAVRLAGGYRAPDGTQNGEPSVPQFDFRTRLTFLRSERGWSLDQLAMRMGVSRQAVWYWETGQRVPRSPHLLKLAETFGVSEAELASPIDHTIAGDQERLIDELKHAIARRNSVAADQVKIVISL